MRADLYLSQHGYAKSRENARKAIEAGTVTIDGKAVTKPSADIDEAAEHTVVFENPVPYVGRGGLKLAGALDAFGIDPSGLTCVDIGASTGGFTDCLLKRGAAFVFAVDSGHGQLDPGLAADPRVRQMEGVNARTLTRDMLGKDCRLAVMDVSFISQTCILPVIPQLLADGGAAVTLIKPQFEVGKSGLGKGGIVKNPLKRREAVKRVTEEAKICGLYLRDIIVSPVTGGDGNTEYLAYFTREAGNDPDAILRKLKY